MEQTVKFEKYQTETLERLISNELTEYSSDLRTATADINEVVTLIENLYLIGYKKDAKEWKKTFISDIRSSADIEKDDRQFALDELKKLDFKALTGNTTVTAATFNGFDSTDWTNYLTKLLDLDSDAACDLLHDINNLRGNEWIDSLKDIHADKVIITAFSKFCKSPIIA